MFTSFDGSDSMISLFRDRASLMTTNVLHARYKAAFRPKTTTKDPSEKASPNVLASVGPPAAAGEVYVSDITYVATREGWLYLAVVIALYSRAVVDWSIAETMHTFWLPAPWQRPLRDQTIS